ncbi:Dimeric alpha-beta barrel [Penicillium occitanis (nom. inval.)]|nr:Dimeric alpha-beta barrel [Penicillium occitanis (nom. inval.)]PCG89826.1 hypothetical protein PENOC_104840 [Penicillium occitanis (nom. inval.)]
MSYSTLIAYPNDDDITFDIDYYLKNHLPLVAKVWGPLSLKSWHAVKYDRDVSGNKPQFLVTATLVWESEETVNAAVSSESAALIFGDIPNFTNKQPVTLAGTVLSSQGL